MHSVIYMPRLAQQPVQGDPATQHRGSSDPRLLVAPMTMTWPLSSRPSMRESSVVTTDAKYCAEIVLQVEAIAQLGRRSSQTRAGNEGGQAMPTCSLGTEGSID